MFRHHEHNDNTNNSAGYATRTKQSTFIMYHSFMMIRLLCYFRTYR